MRDFFHRYVFHNLGLKLISLSLAAGLWLVVAREPVAEVAVDVPIEFRNIPQNMEISSENIPKAQIRLRGSERIVRQLRPADVYASVELEGIKPGARTFDLTARQIHKPRELEVVQIVPSQVPLTFDIRSSRQVPIQPRVIGSFAAGYQIGQVLVIPSTITIVGPKKRVDAVDAATTDPVDVTGTVNRASFVRHPYVSDPLIQVTSPDPVRITVIMNKVSEGGAR